MKIFKYLNILNSKEKIGFLIYFLIFYFSYFFELMGISLILPLLSKNNTQDFFLDNSNFEFIFSFIKNFNSSEILIFMICLIIFKNIFLILANFFNQFLYYKLNTRIGNDVFYYYINLEYEKLLKNKIHTISRKITSEVPIFIDNLVRKIDFLSSLILLSLYLAFGIIIFDGSIYFIIPVLVFLYFINYFFIKKKLRNYGKARVEADDRMNNSIIEFLPGLREILVYGLKSRILKRFSMEITNKFKVILKLNFLTKNNKNFFELFLAIIIVIFAIYLVNEKKYNLGEYLPIIIFYAVLFVRSMPILAELFSIRQKIVFSSISAEETYTDLNIIKSRLKNYNFNKITNYELSEIELKNLNFSYDDNHVFENLNFKITDKSKNIILIFGKNGSGKTTLINLLTGVIRPQTGECFYNFKKLQFENLNQITSLAAQDTILFNGSIKENIAMNFFSDEKEIDDKLVENAIKFSDLQSFIEKFPDGINHHISDGGKNLSGGQKQRIGLARALYKDTKILILDEPTNNLDASGRENLIKTILEISKNKKILIVTHDKDLRKLDSENYEIRDKKLLEIND